MLAQELKMCGYQGYQTVEEVTSACDLQGATTSVNDTQEATVVVDNILDKVGLFRNFLIEECDNINNALAVTMPLEGGDIDRYILYDEAFFTKVSASTGTDWGLTSILAHEVGHHLNGHTLKSGGSNHKVELQADEFSGFVLARMGCSLADAQSAVSKLLPDEASPTHTAKQDRLNAIEIGWNRGNGKTIVVKKIEEVEDPSDITAEQVIANYLYAIGGQEKITQIKTLIKTNELVTTIRKDGNEKEEISSQELIYLTPTKFITKTETSSDKYTYILIADGKLYLKNKIGKQWKRFKNTQSESASIDISYFKEYSYLVNNNELIYKGIENIDGIDCYKISIPEPEIFSSESGSFKIDTKIYFDRYYQVDTGLLFIEEMTTIADIDYKNETKNLQDTKMNMVHRSKHVSYKPVDGIQFPEKTVIEIMNYSDGKLTNTSTLISNLINIEINPPINKENFITK